MTGTANEELSERGQRVSKPSQMMKIIFQVWGNLYDKEKNPNGVVSLGVAENNLMQNELCEYLQKKADIQPFDLTYGDGATGSTFLRKSVAKFINKHFNPLEEVDHEHIIVTNGASAVLEQLSFVLANPGEGFLLGKPYYGGFVGDFETKSEVNAVTVSMQGIDPLGPECVKRYEEALIESESKGVKIRALILCNPHNPLGKCYPVETITALQRFCKKYSLHLISDEIYAKSLYPPPADQSACANPFVSILSIPPEMPTSHIHLVYGASKDFSFNGLRLGVFHSRNKNVLGAAMAISMFGKISGASDRLWYNVLEDEKFLDWYFAENSKRLAEGRDIVVTWLEKQGIPYVKGSNAGYFIWADFRAFLPPDDGESFQLPIERERVLTQAMIDNKVFLATGESFGGEEPGFYRITFSSPREILELGLRNLERTLEKFRAAGKEEEYARLGMRKLAV